MASRTRAGIEFRGNSLRYAEVENNESVLRLVRLGSCDFDFNAEEQVFGGDEALWLGTIADALRDVFRGTQAQRLTVVVNPANCIAASVPVPAGVAEEERDELIGWDLSHFGSGERLRISSSFDREDEFGGTEIQWFDATALSPHYFARIEQIVAALPPRDIALTPSYRGAAKAVTPAEKGNGENGLSLGVGAYGRSVEFFLIRDGHWVAGTHALTAVSADYPYFAAGFVQEAGYSTRNISDIYWYGERHTDDAADLMARVVSGTVHRLNPLQLVRLEAESLRRDFLPEAFAPCVGACI